MSRRDSDVWQAFEPAAQPEQTTEQPDKLFDVMCSIGSVYAGGTVSPREAAFAMIAQTELDGEYSFPAGPMHEILYVTVRTVKE